MSKVKQAFSIQSAGAFILLLAALLFAVLSSACSAVQADSLGKTAWAQDRLEAPAVSLDDIPESDGLAVVTLNDNEPYFSEGDFGYEGFEAYSDLDSEGRCGVCEALIGTETMPTEERGSIGQVKPTGWHTAKYDWVDGKYLYNRCHLIGFQLSGENANKCNLITGTRSMNVDGMEPYENEVANYVRNTGNHVMYRVTPLFEGDDLVARGVVMEALSVEDDGAGVEFCVFCYNEEPGVEIDYATGDNWADGTVSGIVVDSTSSSSSNADSSGSASDSDSQASDSSSAETCDYVLNTNSKKFHKPDCTAVAKMSDGNKDYFTGTRDEVIAQGYDPCGICKP